MLAAVANIFWHFLSNNLQMMVVKVLSSPLLLASKLRDAHPDSALVTAPEATVAMASMLSSPRRGCAVKRE